MERVSCQPKYKRPLKQKYKSLHLFPQTNPQLQIYLKLGSLCLLLPVQLKNITVKVVLDSIISFP